VLSYCEGWLKRGLGDRALTRDLDWGVKVPLPGYENKVIYVWFEALIGYISSSKEWAEKLGTPDKWKEFWLDSGTKYIAFIGKDNVVFHCMIFPAMLMASRDFDPKVPYVLPDNVPANEFLNLEGKKLSKSRNWSIDLKDYLETFPPDPLRYALGINMPETHDTDFYWKDFQARNNNELADILGNFVNRTLAFSERYFENRVPGRSDLSVLDAEMMGSLKAAAAKAGDYFERFRFRDGIQEIMNLARSANKYFNDSQPWKTRIESPTRCSTTINICLNTVRSLAVLIEPFLPFSSVKIWRMLNLSGTVQQGGWDSAAESCLKSGHELGKSEILFRKIEDTSIEEQIGKLVLATG
jgi:methionyl-tRNA synthetase